MDKDGRDFPGQHKVTFLAHRDKIASFIQQGYSLTHIKRMIPELGSMSYPTLARHAKTYCSASYNSAAASHSSATPRAGTHTIPSNSTGPILSAENTLPVPNAGSPSGPIKALDHVKREMKFEYKPSDGDLSKFVSDD